VHKNEWLVCFHRRFGASNAVIVGQVIVLKAKRIASIGVCILVVDAENTAQEASANKEAKVVFPLLVIRSKNQAQAIKVWTSKQLHLPCDKHSIDH
jgi:hypothetical protein